MKALKFIIALFFLNQVFAGVGSPLEVIYSLNLNDVNETPKTINIGYPSAQQEYVPVNLIVRNYIGEYKGQKLHIMMGTSSSDNKNIFNSNVDYYGSDGYVIWGLGGKKIIPKNQSLYLTYYCGGDYSHSHDDKPCNINPVSVEILAYPI